MKKRINFNARISNMLRAMLQEMWKTIEERAKTDERYDAPKRFLERTYDRGKNFCEVDINGCSYPVSGIRLEKPWHGRLSEEIHLTVTSDGYDYSVSDMEGTATILTALRKQRCRKAA